MPEPRQAEALAQAAAVERLKRRRRAKAKTPARSAAEWWAEVVQARIDARR